MEETPAHAVREIRGGYAPLPKEHTLWDEHLLQRKIGATVDPDSEQEQECQYYVYVLEASLCFRNGMVIPLISEFLDY
ncbi:MAG: hypothetical protein GY703_01560 [Gammaproteobacteria bacterium]|nr:hypothetical protein [Gammaproteobacteria bacterium]